MSLSLRIEGVMRTKRMLALLKERIPQETRRFVNRGTQKMYDRAREYTSLTDHSLADLARLGHPYARRFAPDTLHPDYLVHIQTGTLQAGLSMGLAELAYEVVGWVANSTWYDPYVQLGTRFMRPRPYMHQVAVDLAPTLAEEARVLFGDLVAVVVAGPPAS